MIIAFLCFKVMEISLPTFSTSTPLPCLTWPRLVTSQLAFSVRKVLGRKQSYQLLKFSDNCNALDVSGKTIIIIYNRAIPVCSLPRKWRPTSSFTDEGILEEGVSQFLQWDTVIPWSTVDIHVVQNIHTKHYSMSTVDIWCNPTQKTGLKGTGSTLSL